MGDPLRPWEREGLLQHQEQEEKEEGERNLPRGVGGVWQSAEGLQRNSCTFFSCLSRLIRI